jgi:hypothetical protein
MNFIYCSLILSLFKYLISSSAVFKISFISSTEVVLITSKTLDIESTLLLTINGYDLKNEDVPEVLDIIGTDPFNKLKKV